MAVTDKEIRRIGVLAVIFILLLLSFLVIRPIIMSIFFGLILAYIFYPLYKYSFRVFKEGNLAALFVSVIAMLIIVIPLWFIIPVVIQQVFEIFKVSQTINIGGFVDKLIPSVSQQLRIDISTAIVTFIGKGLSAVFTTLTSFILNLPNLLLHFTVIIFVFFFGLRDAEKLKRYASEISPLKKDKAKLLVKQFKDMTTSILFGHIIIGIIQGILTGVGLLIFGVPKALLLTAIAIFASVLPIVGAWLIWIPAAVYLFYQGNTLMAILFSAYSLFIVSTIDNILRPFIVARRTDVSSVVVLVGMIGGLFVFGVLGLILGPLILAYLILFLEAYKNKTISELFNAE